MHSASYIIFTKSKWPMPFKILQEQLTNIYSIVIIKTANIYMRNRSEMFANHRGKSKSRVNVEPNFESKSQRPKKK